MNQDLLNVKKKTFILILGFLLFLNIVSLTISADQNGKISIDMSEVKWSTTSIFIYDGSEKEMTLRNLPSEVTAVYTNNKAINVGEYEAQVSFVYDQNIYVLSMFEPSILSKKWHITKGTYDMSRVSFLNHSIVEDGTAKSIYITGALPTGVSVAYEGNSQVDPGVYEVTASFNGDFKNYTYLSPKKATMTIMRKLLKDETEQYSITSEYGILPYLSLKSEELGLVNYENTNLSVAGTFQEIKYAFSLQLFDNGDVVEPENRIEVEVTLPPNCVNVRDIQIYEYNASRISSVQATERAGKLTFVTDHLSKEYLIIGMKNTYTNNDYWKALLLLGVCVLGGIGIYAGVRLRKRKNTIKKEETF